MSGQGRKKAIFTGPERCVNCGNPIVSTTSKGVTKEYDFPEKGPYPNTVWSRHTCPKKDAAV